MTPMILIPIILFIFLLISISDTVQKVIEYRQELYKNSLGLDELLNMSEADQIKNGLVITANPESGNPSIFKKIF